MRRNQLLVAIASALAFTACHDFQAALDHCEKVGRCPADGSSYDAGPVDGGSPRDGGVPDSGSRADAGEQDAGGVDAGPVDAGPCTGTPSMANSTLTASPLTQTADGTSAVTLVATVQDCLGNPVPGETVTFTATGTANSFSPSATGITNSQGTVSAMLSSTRAETKAVTAYLRTFDLFSQVSFVAGPPDPGHTQLTVAPASVLANGTAIATLTATVADVYGNPVSNQTVAFSGSGVGNVFTPGTQVTTSSSGQAMTQLSSTTAEVETIRAVVGTVTRTVVLRFYSGNTYCTGGAWRLPSLPLVYGGHGGSPHLATLDVNRDGKLDLLSFETSSFSGDATYVETGKGNGIFQASGSDFPSSSAHVGFAFGDFNRDGYLDLAYTAQGNNTLQTSYGDNLLSFSPGPPLTTGSRPGQLIAVDLDGDGWLDLATPATGSNQVDVAWGLPDGGFSALARFDAGAGPVDLVSADFNGDGKPDLAIADSTGFAVALLYGVGSRNFSGPAYVDAGGPSAPPARIAMADFNGDGHPDLAVAASSVELFLGAADGGFLQGPVLVPPTGIVNDVVPADVNGDGRMDLVINDGVELEVFAGSGPALFDAGVLYPAGGQGLAVGDFNNDGYPDLISGVGSDLYVQLGDGGTFDPFPPRVIAPNGSDPVVGDFNHDGKPDLASALPGKLSVLLGVGNGSFQQPTLYDGGSQAYLAGGDLDRDGNLDLVQTDANSGTAMVFLGKADGTFVPSGSFAAGSSPGPVILADLDGDGLLDLVAGGTSVVVALGNGDGTFQPALPGVACGGGELCTSLAVADFNGDGLLDVALSGAGIGAVMINQGGGILAAGNPFGGSWGSVLAGDYNQDGIPDLICDAIVYLGKGDGTFTKYDEIIQFGAQVPTVAGDFNNDGLVDFGMLNGNQLQIYLGTGITGSIGWVLTPYLGGGYASAIGVADFNGDGKTDFAVANSTLGTIETHLYSGCVP